MKIKIKKTYSGLSINQYIELNAIMSDKKLDDTRRVIRAVSVASGKPYEVINGLPVTDVIRCYSHLDYLQEPIKPVELNRKHFLCGPRILTLKKLEEITFDDYTYVKKLIEDDFVKNIAEIVNRFVKGSDPVHLGEYMSIQKAYDIAVFFCQESIRLSQTTLTSLEEAAGRLTRHVSTSLKDGDGIAPLTH